MRMIDEGERVTEALIRSTGLHSGVFDRGLQMSEPARPLTIAVSRETGTGGAAIARTVGSRLGWSVYDHELLELIARDLQVRVKLIEEVDERHVSWLQETIEAFCNVSAVREGTYVRHLVETMLSLAARGRCVIVGRGASFVLPSSTTLRVRLTAPLEERITNICREQHMSRHEAARHIAQTDRARMQFVREHFMHDPTDAGHYDLVLNTGMFSIDECASLIAEASHARHGIAAA